MSELRKHLQSAKGQYESLRYPGDLGAQILGKRQHSSAGRWVVGTIFAAAAAMFIVLWLNLPGPKTPGNGTIAVNPSTQPPQDGMLADASEQTDYIDETGVDDETEYTYTDMPMLSFPEVPDDITFTPATPSFSVAVPTFSLLGDETSEQESPSI